MSEEQQAITFNRLQFLIFDEADELFATNFQQGIFRFLKEMHFLKEVGENQFRRVSKDYDDVQVMTFAADDSFEKSAKVVFKNYKETVRVSQATKISDLMSTNRKIESCINGKIYQQLLQALDYPTKPKDRAAAMNDQRKNETVFDLIDTNIEEQTLIFANTRSDVDRLYNVIINYREANQKKTWEVQKIHGGLQQSEREEATRRFKSGEINVLIATSVISRGLDVSGVTLVIQYMLPEVFHERKARGNGKDWLRTVAAEYLYRIGRTGRHGQSGNFRAISFFSPMNENFAPRLLNFLDTAQSDVPDWLVAVVDKQRLADQKTVQQAAKNSQAVMNRNQRRA